MGDAVRGLKNNLAEKVLDIEKRYEKEEAAKRIQQLCTGSLLKAAVEGEVEYEGSVLVGQVVGMLNKVQSVNEIMAELIKEYSEILKRAPQFL